MRYNRAAGEDLRALRIEKGFVQKEFPWTRAQVGRIERGDVDITLAHLRAYAVTLDVTAREVAQRVFDRIEAYERRYGPLEEGTGRGRVRERFRPSPLSRSTRRDRPQAENTID